MFADGWGKLFLFGQTGEVLACWCEVELSQFRQRQPVRVKCYVIILGWVRFRFSSVTNSSSEWSLFASPSFISSKPLVKRPRTMSLTPKVEIAPKWFDLLRPKDALVLFNQALGAAGTRIDQSSYSGQSGKVWDVFR